MYQVNVQTAEVYAENKMLMLVPPAISQHKTFVEAFEASPPNLCMLVSSLKNCQQIQIDVPAADGSQLGPVTYEVSRWEPLPEDVIALGRDFQRLDDYVKFFGVAGSGSFVPASNDGCHNIPVSNGEIAKYLGREFSKKWSPDVPHHWVSDVIEHLDITPLSTIWFQEWPLPSELDVCPGLLWFSGNDNSSPSWLEIAVYQKQRYLRLFQLVVVGRQVTRIPVFCSDYQRDISGLSPLLKVKETRLPSVCARMTMLSLDDVAAQFDKGSVVVSRSRWIAPSSLVADDVLGCETQPVAVAESFASKAEMLAVLPAALVDQYQWWKQQQVGAVVTVRGVPRTGLESTSVDVVVKRQPDGHAQTEVFRRLETGESQWFLDLSVADPSSNLGQLATWACKLDNLSHVLAWSDSSPEYGDECDVSVVEFPRLGLVFRSDGTALRCENHPQLVVPSSVPLEVQAILDSMPFGVVLVDFADQYHVIIGNFPIHCSRIESQPFSCNIHRCVTATWNAVVKSRYFLCPVHSSRAFLAYPSLASLLYMIMLSLAKGKYRESAALIDTWYTDRPLSSEEAFILRELFDATKEDFHPDAHACRLKLMAAFLDGVKSLAPPAEESRSVHPRGHMEMRLPGQAPVVQNDPLDLSNERIIEDAKLVSTMTSYIDKLAHVSPHCVLGVGEEHVVLETISRRCSHRGMSVQLQNRLAVISSLVLDDADDVTALVTVTKTLETGHPYGDMNWVVKYRFHGASSVMVSFDESTEMRPDSDFVRIYADEALTKPCGEEKYTGSVFNGNWCGCRPNPFKPARPPLVIQGDTVVIQSVAAASAVGDWGWRMYLTADVLVGCGVSSAIVGDSAVGLPDQLLCSSTNLTSSLDNMLQLRVPRTYDGSTLLQFSERMSQLAVCTYDLKKMPWTRKVHYKRPAVVACSSVGVLSLVDAGLKDSILGDEQKLGWLFLYELISGQVALKLTDTSRYLIEAFKKVLRSTPSHNQVLCIAAQPIQNASVN